MQVRLMNRDSDFDPDLITVPFAEDLVQDLQLDYLLDAMAGGDKFLRGVSKAALLQPLSDASSILYRQQALDDCLTRRDSIKQLYGIVMEALERPRSIFMLPVRHRPERELSYDVRLLTGLADQLERLRSMATVLKPQFRSSAFRDFFSMLEEEMDVDYMVGLRGMLKELSFPAGMVMSAGIGIGGTVAEQILRRPKESNRRLFDRTPLKRPLFSFTIPDRDEAGASALAELRDRSVNEVANAASQSLDHVQGFFRLLRIELGFYLACCNAVDRLEQLEAPVCVPSPADPESLVAEGIYDPCLALRIGSAPVGNEIDLGLSRLLLVTGANRGGKSTLLRALGTAQLMMQAGLQAPAKKFTAIPVERVFTHWAREEDTGLTRGKLDEELERMERIVAEVRRGDLLLCNESFSSTNEAEGSQIALDVTTALVTSGVQVRSVTHLFDFVSRAAADAGLEKVCLRAPRSAAGERSYRLEPGPPLPTSYGLDLYDRVFGTHYSDTAALMGVSE